MTSEKQELLIRVATDLFYRNGFHATGIDKILEEANVAKMTLYNHFRSKDELILASLRRQDEAWREWFIGAVERRAKDPVGRLLAMFDALEESFSRKGFCGCPFIKATSEYPDLHDPVHQIAIGHEQKVHSYVRGLAEETGAKDADGLAKQLCLLLKGAIAAAQVTGRVEAARHAGKAAEQLVRNAISKTKNLPR